MRPTYQRQRSLWSLLAMFGLTPAVLFGAIGYAARWVDARYVKTDTYRADREAYRAKRFADSVHHAADDEVNARVALAVDSIEHPHRRPRVLQAGEPR